MKRVIFILTILFSISLKAQFTLDGVVFDKETNKPLIGATLIIDNSFNGGFTDKNGNFRLNNVIDSKVLLITSYIGYKTDSLEINLSINEDVILYLEALSYQTDEVIVNGTRVLGNSPVTFTNVSKKEIEKNNLGQDLPYLLQQTPSVVTTSDAGTGIGYTGLRIRGSDASRINVTINGVPLNDPESHGVFWVNMPDFASSLSSIQIQRGIGTSTNGAGAFGATVNLETNTINAVPFGEINNSVGFLENNQEFDNVQYNSRKHTVSFGSGLIDNRFSIEGRLSNIQSNGYIDRARADLKSYYLSAGYYGEKTVLKALSFGGSEVTYQSWYGTPQSRYENDRTGMQTHAANNGLTNEQTENLLNSGRDYNFYTYEDQVDNYDQNHYQLHLSHQFNTKLIGNVSLHYTKGIGYFEQFKEDEDFSDYGLLNATTANDTITSTDLVRRRWLNNDFYGMTYSLLYEPSNHLKITFGGGLNNYEGDHYGEIFWTEFSSTNNLGDRYYFNEAHKFDVNSYLKTTYAVDTNLSLYADLQIRRINYNTKGIDNDLRAIDVDEDFTFFNPKIGANYSFNTNAKIYLFAGIGNREPNRADFTDQPSNTPKKDANKSERMYNIELGTELNYSNFSISGNIYGMFYQDQLVITGQLNDAGSPLRQNVDKSYRLGFELQAGYKINDKLTWNLTATFSDNKILKFDELIYDYTNGFDVITVTRENTDIALSPKVIAGSEFSFKPIKNIELALITRYVGEQFLDNSSNTGSMIDSYFVNDIRFQTVIPQKLFKVVKVQLLVNNVLNEDYVSNGYTYSYIFENKVTENFYYPQSFRNYMIGLNLKF